MKKKEIWDELTDAELEFVAGGASEQTLANTSDYGGCCCGPDTNTEEPPACCCNYEAAPAPVGPVPGFDAAARGGSDG